MTGIIDQHIDGAELLDGLGHHVLHLRTIGHVQSNSQAGLRILRRDRFQFLHAPGRNDSVVTIGKHGPCDPFSNTAGTRAGDNPCFHRKPPFLSERAP